MSDTTDTAAKVSVVAARVVQATLAFVAGVLVLGALIGNMNVIAFAAVGIFALVLLAFAGVLQLWVSGVREWVA